MPPNIQGMYIRIKRLNNIIRKTAKDERTKKKQIFLYHFYYCRVPQKYENQKRKKYGIGVFFLNVQYVCMYSLGILK